MKLHIKSPGEKPGVYPIVKRGEGLRHLSFTVVELGGSLNAHRFESGGDEVSLDFHTGPVRVEVESQTGRFAWDIPNRPTIRETGPMVYVPAGSRVNLKALDGSARVTVAGAAGKPGIQARLIGGDDVMAKRVGQGNWSRMVYTHIGENIDAASLICGETVNQPGGWSSCPPHKHDRFEAPAEVPMEEVYYFQVEPKQGFGFMRVYTDPDDAEPFDYSYAVEHGDTVLIPRGYHPVVAAPGYALSFLWVLAGDARKYGAWKDDPRHAWIKAA